MIEITALSPMRTIFRQRLARVLQYQWHQRRPHHETAASETKVSGPRLIERKQTESNAASTIVVRR
jgi:hypothetical protein